MSMATTLRSWWTDRKAETEFNHLGSGERAAIARDVRLPEEMLSRIVEHGGTGRLELSQLLSELGMDEGEIAREHPGVMRDLEATCTGCDGRSRCHRNLERSTAAENFETYCPNAVTIEALLVQKAHRAGF